MARKAITITQPATPVMDDEVVRQDLTALDKMHETQAASEDALALGRAIGRIETAEFYQTISDSVKLSAFDEAKKSKAYALLVNPKTKTYFGSIEEFCADRLGVTYERMRQLSGNRSVLGQQTYEQSVRLGLRQIDYNVIKSLPAPDQELIRQAVEESSSRDDVLNLLQELAARHAKEKETLTAERDEAQATAEARVRVLSEKETTISKLQEKLAGKKRATPELLAEEALRDIDQQALACVGEIAACLRQKFVEAGNLESFAANRTLIEQAQRAAIGRVLAAVHQLADDYGIATLGADATPEAHDVAAEDEAIWAAVNAEMAGQQDESAH